uniref:Uncharacterized protein n=1 Tax=Tanacetum cinerariifolium TaxID=118510 RepID=A0A6L2KZ85_TANCI|nr:hypothetical protein [Tanacetum cinerariifolium]
MKFMFQEVDKIVEGEEGDLEFLDDMNVDNKEPDTRLHQGSQKESPEDDNDDDECIDDTLIPRKQKGSLDSIVQKKHTLISTPYRSPRIHLSSDKESSDKLKDADQYLHLEQSSDCTNVLRTDDVMDSQNKPIMEATLTSLVDHAKSFFHRSELESLCEKIVDTINNIVPPLVVKETCKGMWFMCSGGREVKEKHKSNNVSSLVNMDITDSSSVSHDDNAKGNKIDVSTGSSNPSGTPNDIKDMFTDNSKLSPAFFTKANLRKLEANVPNGVDYETWLHVALVHEEVATGNMATTSGMQEVDYLVDLGSDDEVEPVENKMANFLASKSRGVGYGTWNSLSCKCYEENMNDAGNKVGPTPTSNNPGMSSYANVTSVLSRKALNFHTLFTPNRVDVVVSMESNRAISELCANTEYGFFLGKRVAFLIVANYFSSIEGLDVVLKNGPWFIRNNPFILKKYNPDVNLLKEDVVNVLVWIKLHGVPVTAFSKDGLSAIATKLAMPKLVGEEFYTCTSQVEYEWKPPRCAYCNIFGHVQDEYPKNIDSNVVKNMKKPSQATKGVLVGLKVGFLPVKQVFRQVSKKTISTLVVTRRKMWSLQYGKKANSSGSLFWNMKSSSTSTTPIVEKIDNIKRLIIEGKATIVDDEGKPLVKVVSLGDHDSDDEVASVDNDMAKFLALKKVRYGTNSLLEQWKESYKNDDYDFDPYDDNTYEGHDIPDKIQARCDNLDIKDKGKGQTSRAKDEGFYEMKKKKLGGNNGGTKNFTFSIKLKTQYRLKAKQSTDGACNSPKTTSFIGTNKTSNLGYNKESTSNKGNTFSHSISFEALNDENIIIEEVSTGSMTTTSVDYLVDLGSDDEVEPVEKNGKFFGFKSRGVGYGQNNLNNRGKVMWNNAGLESFLTVSEAHGIHSHTSANEENMNDAGNKVGLTLAGNKPGMSLYANVTGVLSRKALNFHTLFSLARNRVDVVVSMKSIRAISERFANTAYGFFLGKRVAYLVVANYIEVRADVELKDHIVVAMPKLVGEGFWTCTVHVEYENMKKPSQATRGVLVLPMVGFKPVKQVFRQLSKKTLSTLVVIRRRFGAFNRGKVTIMDDEGKPWVKVDSLGDHDSDDEVASVDKDMENFLASKKVGYGTNYLLKQ